MEQFFCAQLSRQHSEPLFGTASQFQSLFLLECAEAWGAKAFVDSHLSAEVKQSLRDQLATLTQPRLLFIKQGEKIENGKINFFAVHNQPGKSHYNHFTFDSYDELMDFDLAASLPYTPQSRHEPLYMVCTNGNKDKCCAKFGMACYKHLLAKIPKERVWQCAHVGGDRFAPNIVTAPEGAYFARFDENQLDDFIALNETGQINLDFYRGRSWYAKDVQSAEYYIRQASGNLSFDDLEFVEKSLDGEICSVTFRILSTGDMMTARMIKKVSDYESFLSCRDTEKGRVESFRLIDIIK